MRRALVFGAVASPWPPRLGACGGSGGSSTTDKAADAEVLNEILARQLAAVDAYGQALPALRGADLALARRFRAQEQEHVDATTKTLRGLEAEADPPAETIEAGDLKTPQDAMHFLYELESATIDAELHAVGKLTIGWPRPLIASMAANQAQRLVLIRRALGADAARTRPRGLRDRRNGRPRRDDAAMTAPLYAIGRFCSRHHYPVIAVWIVLAIALLAISHSAGSKTSENLTLPGTDSTKATELLEDDLPEQAYGSNPLVLEAPQGKLTEAKYAAAVAETEKKLNALDDVNSAVSPLSPQGANFLSKDQSIGYFPVVLSVGPGEIDEEEAEQILDAAGPAAQAGLQRAIGAYVGQQLSKPATETSEAIGLAAAVIILLFAFGTATAMMLPIVSAVIGLACALSIIRLLEHVLEVPGVASTLATMIGLGVGIDYALFIVTRHKLQLADGMELRESIARATATAGGAVVFAGFTVVIALCSLAFAGIPLVSTLGFTAAVAVVVAVCAATTLLPAMLGALGPHINSLRVKLGKTHPDDKEPHGWRRWARMGQRAALDRDRGRPGDPHRPGAAGPPAAARPERHQRPAEGNDLAPGLRLAQQGLRAGRQRPAADRLRIHLARGSQTGAAEAGESGRGRRGRRGGHRTDPRQAGHGRGLHRDLEIGAMGGRDRRPGRRPARRSDPGGAGGDRRPAPTSAARPPATSTSPTRSATSCR